MKNYEGTITFDTNLKQLIRQNNKKESGFKYPITQAEHIKYELMKWLDYRGFSGLPIYYFIAIAETSTIMKVHGDAEQIAEVISHVEEIPFKLIRKNEQLKGRVTQNNQLKHKMISKIMRECEDFSFDVLTKFNVKKNEIITGVQCINCKVFGMNYYYGKWTCSYCQASCGDAHIRALDEYFLLFGNSITNEEARNFLHVTCRFQTTRILKNANLIHNNKKKSWHSNKN